jgi:hypothetical protein
MAGHMVCSREIRNPYTNFVGKPEGKRSLGRSRRRWEDKIRRNLKEIVCEGVGSVHVAQNRGQWLGLVITIMSLRTP